ncbi:MAG: hypothetical protein ACI85I_001433, partial [Arenicella sp.]
MQKMNTFKLKTAFVFTIATLFCFTLSAQDYTFKVTSVKGTAKSNGTQLFVGSKVKAGSTINIEDGTTLNIAHNNGKTLTVTKAGSYKVDDLAKGVSAKSGSLSEKYAAFVLNELTAGKTDGIGANNMSKTGSVKRTIVDNTKAVNFMTERKTHVAPTTITLKWYPNDLKIEKEKVEKYTFVVSDLMSNEIYREETTQPSITVDLGDQKFTNAMSGAIQYHVIVNNDQRLTSPEYMLQIVQGEANTKITQDVKSLSTDNTAINKLILAKYFEDHGLYANAMFAYEEAIKMSESNEMYENMYQAFLDRNYLSKKAKQMGSKKTNAETKK